MKKTYINPNLKVVRLKMNQRLLSGSPVIQNNNATTNGNGDYEDARRFDFDDEEY